MYIPQPAGFIEDHQTPIAPCEDDDRRQADLVVKLRYPLFSKRRRHDRETAPFAFHHSGSRDLVRAAWVSHSSANKRAAFAPQSEWFPEPELGKHILDWATNPWKPNLRLAI